jgi:outer membrane protein OmpA-like peptidoglycan-associated protein
LEGIIIASKSNRAVDIVLSRSFSYALACGLTLALPAKAAPLLEMPAPATVISGWSENPATLRLPVGPFADGTLPLQEVAGAVAQRAYRMDNQRLTTLQLITPLLAQLEAAGYATQFACEAQVCGGFDFRYGMDVLPEPQMHVDLGDFRYVLAERDAQDGVDVTALLVSRSADQGFVQVSTVSAKPGSVILPLRTEEVRAALLPTATAPSLPEDLAGRLVAGGAVTLDDLVFASGTAELQDRSFDSLSQLAAWLAANADRRVTLVGHTDATGALQANINLSRLRSQSVRAALLTRYGAAGGQIDAQGAGYLAPRATNETPEGRALNRRVEVLLNP